MIQSPLINCYQSGITAIKSVIGCAVVVHCALRDPSVVVRGVGGGSGDPLTPVCNVHRIAVVL